MITETHIRWALAILICVVAIAYVLYKCVTDKGDSVR